MGYLDDEKGPIHKLVKQWKVALRLHAEFGTEPNVYYVPPLSPAGFAGNGSVDQSRPRIPIEYLRSLFGSGTDGALDTLKSEMAKRKRGEKSELMDILIVYRWPNDIFPDFTHDPATLKWT